MPQGDNIRESLRYYIQLYDIQSRFDSGAPLIVRVLLLVLFLIVYNWFGFFFRLLLRSIEVHKYMSIVFSKNQYKIGEYLKENGLDITIISFGNFTNDADHKFTHRFIFFAALANSKESVALIIESFSDKIFKDNFKRIIKLSGINYLLNKSIKPSKVAFNFNDHSPANVLYYDYAKRAGASTVYIQHAPVTDKFPELYHDLNVLFSQDSIAKYRNPSQKEILEFFDLRLPEIKKSKPEKEKVLVCTNPLDNLSKVKSLCNALHDKGFKILYRKHPRDERSFTCNLQNFSISISQNIFDDIESCELVIADESAVLLEALYLQRPIYKASFFCEDINDHYGYLDKGLIKEQFFSNEAIVKAVENRVNTADTSLLPYFIGKIEDRNSVLNELLDWLNYFND